MRFECLPVLYSLAASIALAGCGGEIAANSSHDSSISELDAAAADSPTARAACLTDGRGGHTFVPWLTPCTSDRECVDFFQAYAPTGYTVNAVCVPAGRARASLCASATSCINNPDRPLCNCGAAGSGSCTATTLCAQDDKSGATSCVTSTCD
jgi:hypothetical protein